MNWISMDERKPDENDKDEYGCVLVWHLFQGVMVMGWRLAREGMYHTHWMPTPKQPDGIKERQREFEERVIKTRFRE